MTNCEQQQVEKIIALRSLSSACADMRLLKFAEAKTANADCSYKQFKIKQQRASLFTEGVSGQYKRFSICNLASNIVLVLAGQIRMQLEFRRIVLSVLTVTMKQNMTQLQAGVLDA